MAWVDNDVENFLSLKKPDEGFGFFSPGNTGDKDTFVEGLEGEFEGIYTGVMGRVSSEKTAVFVKAVKELLKAAQPEMEENDWEAYFAMWKKEDYSFFILAELGSTDQVCSKLKKMVKDSALFEEGSTNEDEMDYLEVPKHFKQDLISLQKGSPDEDADEDEEDLVEFEDEDSDDDDYDND